MEIDQVVYEYGKLQLNFVSCQRQNALLGTNLAQTNKVNAQLTADRQKAVARVAQLEKFITDMKLFIPEVPPEPEPAKDPAPGPEADLGRGQATVATDQAPTGVAMRRNRLVTVPAQGPEPAEPSTEKQ